MFALKDVMLWLDIMPTPSPQGGLGTLWFPIAGGQVREKLKKGDQARIGLASHPE